MKSKITLFITGAAVMILQIIGVRILATQLGTTVAVWSCMIAVTITALAIGYYLGGYYADKGTNQKTRALCVAGAGIAVLLIIPLKEVVFMIGSSLPYGVRATIVSFLLFVIPTILLAMTTTYTTRMELDVVSKAGSNSGTLYAVSTLGSIVGVFGTSFLLIPSFGVVSILCAVAGTLVATAIVGYLTSSVYR